MTIAERLLPVSSNSRLLEFFFKERPADLLASEKRGAGSSGTRLAPCPNVNLANDFIAAECPIGQLFAAVKKAQ